MKNLIAIIVLTIIMTPVFAQDMYQQKMGEAMSSFAQVQNTKDYLAVAGKFELISNVETSKWLPLYYQAQCHILITFIDPKLSATEKDSYLEIAKLSIDKMIQIAPAETEVFALQAFYYTAKLVIDPMTRGQKFSALAQGAIEKSLVLDAANPRAKQLSLSNKIGTAQFFGKDTSPYCAEAEELLSVWDDYKLKTPFHPTWGKDQVKSIIEDCATKDATIKSEPESNNSENEFSLTISIKKLKSDLGYVMLELLDKDEQTITQTLGTVKDGVCIITLNGIDAGDYSIRYFHDSNENNKMDSNKHGIPQESYGFSNNARGFMGPPKHKKTLFNLSGDLTIELKAK